MYKTVKLGSTQAESYLGESVLVQKALTKPLNLQRERSQGGSAMICHEEAGQRHPGRPRVGLTVVPTPAPKAKHESSSSGGLPKRLIRLSSSANRVTGGVAWRKWHLTHTGEVPRRLSLTARVTPAYKARPKWPAYATVKRRPP